MVRYFQEFRTKLCTALSLGCLLCGITLAQSVTTYHLPGIKYSKYHTYRWVAGQHQHPDPAMDAQIKQSFETQFAARGLKKTDGTADLSVEYQIAVSQQETWEVYEDRTQTGLMAQRLPQRRQVIIDEGTLYLDIYDTAAKNLGWEGIASKTLDPQSSIKDRRKSVDKAAKKLLENFSPK